MGCLKSIETPLCAVLTVLFLIDGLYTATYKVIESRGPLDEDAVDSKDMLMISLGIMSLVGLCSSRRAFGVFTLIFMLHTFLFSLFNVFHLVALFVRTMDTPCKFHVRTASSDGVCHVINGAALSCTIVSLVASALASMAVFVRLTTVVLHISEMRGLATSRSFDNSLPRLLRKVSIESDREEDLPEHKPERKMGMADIFV